MTDNRTNELREKLDELGIEHFDYDKGGRTQTQWEAPDGKRHFTYETSDNPAKTARLVIAWHPTTEQAIAATLGSEREKALEELVSNNTRAELGSGTCEVVKGDGEKAGWWVCKSCGCAFDMIGALACNASKKPRFCPNCCAKVVG